MACDIIQQIDDLVKKKSAADKEAQAYKDLIVNGPGTQGGTLSRLNLNCIQCLPTITGLVDPGTLPPQLTCTDIQKLKACGITIDEYAENYQLMQDQISLSNGFAAQIKTLKESPDYTACLTQTTSVRWGWILLGSLGLGTGLFFGIRWFIRRRKKKKAAGN